MHPLGGAEARFLDEEKHKVVQSPVATGDVDLVLRA